jgi:hypothetical protein
MSKLEARVAAANRAGQFAAKVQDLVFQAFGGMVGQKVLTTKGDFTTKALRVLPTFPKAPRLRIVKTGSGFLSWKVDCFEHVAGQEGVVYHEVTVCLGQIGEGGVLAALEPKKEFRVDYTAEEIRRLRGELDEAKTAVSRARQALGDFGEYDY